MISSWFLAIFVGGGLLSLLLTVLYREPICGAYPIAGSALLVTVLGEYSIAEAVGAFLVSGVLVTLLGVTGLFDAVMERVPNEVLMGALAGILLPFGIEVFALLPSQPLLIGSMVAAYLLGVRFVRAVPPALLALVAGFAVAGASGRVEVAELELALSRPVLIPPSFDWGAVVSVAVPLTLLAVATQNAPGVGILRANGYAPPTNAVTIFSGIGSILTAPLVGNGVNIAAPMTAVCAGPEAHPDVEGRYVATVTQGVLFVAFGLAGATVISLIGALPAALIAGVAGLTLLPVILQSLRLSVGGERHALAAGVALLVGASGLSILGINSTFWALVVGVALAKVLGGNEGKKP
ncbi:benzoate/H(+) symporter BenE family transporter [Rubrobacter marinus]|uniref:Benzoate/H(+) symporter BenE family transporter n=1 Tax=Rubrobacter marinus TaxID=2653852 RepID=A0A6G8PX17_9ACTN|nr:benzoate/H(+) symporter BenE family transporter [Rubrobacter marinus]QIN78769.1 benzoate/H(+) symporter BenE family transporter [Rubrobacter marinus]